MKLTVEKIQHRLYGVGKIIDHHASSLSVRLSSKETKVPFTKTTFANFLPLKSVVSRVSPSYARQSKNIVRALLDEECG